jgi:copper transporter 1
MFAGACVGVILLTMSLEFFRRSVKEYDRYLVRTHTRSRESKAPGSPVPMAGFRPSIFQQGVRALLHMVQFAVAYFIMLYVYSPLCSGGNVWTKYRELLLTHDHRRLAMYYNGYIIICIFLGAYLGSFVFHWETMGGRSVHPKQGAAEYLLPLLQGISSPELQTSASQEATVCCG